MLEREQAAMAAFYREVDSDVAALGARWKIRCAGCGECCHFDTADHILYASDLERQYLLAIIPDGGECGQDAELLSRGLRCPYQRGAECAAREGRVLGCRLHFCDPLWTREAGELAERWHVRLKKLHGELGIEWNYAPLFPLDR